MSAWMTVLIVAAYFAVGIGVDFALVSLGLFSHHDAEELAVCAVLWPMTAVAAVGVLVLALAAMLLNGWWKNGGGNDDGK